MLLKGLYLLSSGYLKIDQSIINNEEIALITKNPKSFFLMKRFFTHLMIFLFIFTKSIFYKKYLSDLLKNIDVIKDFQSSKRD